MAGKGVAVGTEEKPGSPSSSGPNSSRANTIMAATTPATANPMATGITG